MADHRVKGAGLGHTQCRRQASALALGVARAGVASHVSHVVPRCRIRCYRCMSYTVQVYDIFHYHNDEPTSADGALCASVRCLPAHSDMLVAPWGVEGGLRPSRLCCVGLACANLPSCSCMRAPRVAAARTRTTRRSRLEARACALRSYQWLPCAGWLPPHTEHACLNRHCGRVHPLTL